jgi:G3E family GTPase
VVGFLGSGKTTLMAHLLDQAIAKGLRIGLVVNDFDEFNVDAHVLQREAGEQNVLELPGGCMCCELGDDLAKALSTLLSLRQFDWFFIETSGLAEPLEVIHQLTAPALLPSIAPRVMAAVIDIEGPVPEQDGARLIWDQARTSQIVLLNKADQIGRESLERAKARILQYNPSVDVEITQDAKIDLDRVLEKAGEVLVPQHGDKHVHIHASFNSWARHLPDNIDRARFEAFLQELPEHIVRVKGFVRFNGEADTYYFNRVGQYIQMAPMKDGGAPPAMIVCIGKNIIPADLETFFQNRLAQ